MLNESELVAQDSSREPKFAMPETNHSANVVVVNPHGIHLRPADLFARTANKFKAKLEVICNGQTVDGKSIIEMLMLAAKQGTQLTLRANGEDAPTAIRTLVELVEQGFDEMEEEATKSSE